MSSVDGHVAIGNANSLGHESQIRLWFLHRLEERPHETRHL